MLVNQDLRTDDNNSMKKHKYKHIEFIPFSLIKLQL